MNQSVWRVRWEIFLIVLGVFMYVLEFPHGIHGDAHVRYDNLLTLLQTHKISPMLYSYVGPLFSAPLLLLGSLVKDGFWWVSRFNTWIFFGAVFYTVRALRQEWSSEQRRLFVLLMFAGTMFPVHTSDYYSEVFSACLVFLAILEFQKNRSLSTIIFVVLSTWNTPGTAAASAVLLAYFSYRSKNLRYVMAIPLLMAGILGENFLKYGELFPKSYLTAEGQHNYLPYSGGPGFTYPLFFGLLSVFFSFGKGLVFFIPGLFAIFSEKLRGKDDPSQERLVASWIYLIGLACVFSRWWCWYGGWFWGPRFYLFGSILGVLGLVELKKRGSLSRGWNLFWVGAVALSVWVGCQGVLYGQDFLEDCYVKDPKLEFICQYVPEYSVLWRLFSVWPMPHGRKWAYLAYFVLVGATVLFVPVKNLVSELAEEFSTLMKRALKQKWKF